MYLIPFARCRVEDAASVRLNALSQACQGAANRLNSTRPRRLQALLATGLFTVLALFATTPSANATFDPLGSGTAKLTLDPSFAHLLATHGVKFSATAPATTRASSATLPLATGSLDPTLGKGELETAGSLVFSRGARRVVLRNVTVKTKPQPLLAKVGGGQLKVASGRLRFSRQGFGSRLATKRLLLTEKVATRLSKKLALRDVFAEGQPFASLSATAQPATLAVLPTGRVTLTPDPAFLAKLDSLFVSLNPIAPAERQPGPLFSFPFIPAGTIAPDGGTGVLRTGGSLEFLQLGAGQIFWHELWFDLAGRQVLAELDIEPTPTFPGKLGQVPILALSDGTLSSDPKRRTVALSGAALALNTQTAAAFNEAFAKPQGKADVFQAGEALAVVSFVAQTQ
jgi:hypothetical protein